MTLIMCTILSGSLCSTINSIFLFFHKCPCPRCKDLYFVLIKVFWFLHVPALNLHHDSCVTIPALQFMPYNCDSYIKIPELCFLHYISCVVIPALWFLCHDSRITIPAIRFPAKRFLLHSLHHDSCHCSSIVSCIIFPILCILCYNSFITIPVSDESHKKQIIQTINVL